MKLLTIFLLLLVWSCSHHQPSNEEVQKVIENYKLPESPRNGNSLIYIVRPDDINRPMEFKVFVDSTYGKDEIGETLGETYLAIHVKPGSRCVYSRGENWDAIRLDLKPNETRFVKQRTYFGAFSAQVRLSEINSSRGKYWVKKLKKGKYKSNNEREIDSKNYMKGTIRCLSKDETQEMHKRIRGSGGPGY